MEKDCFPLKGKRICIYSLDNKVDKNPVSDLVKNAYESLKDSFSMPPFRSYVYFNFPEIETIYRALGELSNSQNAAFIIRKLYETFDKVPKEKLKSFINEVKDSNSPIRTALGKEGVEYLLSFYKLYNSLNNLINGINIAGINLPINKIKKCIKLKEYNLEICLMDKE